MTSLRTIRREVEEIKFRVKPAKDVWVRFGFPVDPNQPYGRYGSCLFNVGTREQKAVTEEVEVAELREFYDKLPKHAKREHNGYSWKTFEDFLKHHERK